MKRFIIFSIVLVSLFCICSCGKKEKVTSDYVKEIIVKDGTYSLTDEKDSPSFVIKGNTLQLVNFDFDEIVKHYEAAFPHEELPENARERLEEPYEYCSLNKKNHEIGFQIFDNYQFGAMLIYNETDGILTYKQQDYHLVSENGSDKT